jgi:hypothetical protein
MSPKLNYIVTSSKNIFRHLKSDAHQCQSQKPLSKVDPGRLWRQVLKQDRINESSIRGYTYPGKTLGSDAAKCSQRFFPSQRPFLPKPSTAIF